jgi:precorrin-6x reductase
MSADTHVSTYDGPSIDAPTTDGNDPRADGESSTDQPNAFAAVSRELAGAGDRETRPGSVSPERAWDDATDVTDALDVDDGTARYHAGENVVLFAIGGVANGLVPLGSISHEGRRAVRSLLRERLLARLEADGVPRHEIVACGAVDLSSGGDGR